MALLIKGVGDNLNGVGYIILAITFNVFAQVLLKFSSGKILPLTIHNLYIYGVFCALLLYGLSFFLTLKIYSVNSLSLVSPLMAGLTILCITTSGVFLFAESLSNTQVVGIILTIFGVVLLSIK